MSFLEPVVGIQSRLYSSRLPCKAMLSFAGTSLLGYLIRRSLACGYDTYLLTSDQPEDDILEREARLQNVTDVIRGSIHDVRSRYLSLANMSRRKYIVRVTGDNPFTDFRLIKHLVSDMVNSQAEYSWLDPSCCPDGINLEVFTSELLSKSIHVSSNPQDLEHVTPSMKSYLKANGLWLNWFPKGASDYHLGIDLKDDYYKILSLLNERFHDNHFMYSHDIVDKLVNMMLASSTYPKLRRHDL